MATLREQISSKIAPLLAPIAGPEPVGADPSYDPDFERMKAEVDKLSSVDAREPSWRDIRELGTGMLATKAKDLRVAGWVGVAQLKIDGWAGFAEGLTAYDGLARNFWATMYPDAKRVRGRVSAFTWLTELTAKHLRELPVSFAEGDAVRACDEALRTLDTFLAEKLGEAYPGPGTLRSVMREKVASIPAEAPGAPKPAAAPPPPIPAAPPAGARAPEAGAGGGAQPAPADGAAGSANGALPSVPAEVGDGRATADTEAAIRDCARKLVSAAGELRAADVTRPLAYRLQRWGAWLTVQDPPPVEENRTRIRPPPDTLPRRLTMLRDGQKWLELLKAAEDATGAYLFWLDPHRAVAQAMDRLGPSFLGAREVVGREVVAFLTRVPAVVNLAFANGMAFADAATKSWLEEEARKWGGGGSSSSAGAAAASAEDEEVAKRFADAEAMVVGGQVADGLGAASALAARGADKRTRFRAGLAVGKMALKGSQPEVARAILERLASDVEKHDLEEWEPGLCASLYASLLTATRELARGKSSSPELASRQQALLERLCRLDPAGALKFTSG